MRMLSANSKMIKKDVSQDSNVALLIKKMQENYKLLVDCNENKKAANRLLTFFLLVLICQKLKILI